MSEVHSVRSTTVNPTGRFEEIGSDIFLNSIGVEATPIHRRSVRRFGPRSRSVRRTAGWAWGSAFRRRRGFGGRLCSTLIHLHAAHLMPDALRFCGLQ